MKSLIVLLTLICTNWSVHAAEENIVESCERAGRVVAAALRASYSSAVLDEAIEWKGLDFYKLSPRWRKQIIEDIAILSPAIMVQGFEVRSKIPELNRQGLDGESIARHSVDTGFEPMKEMYAVSCIKRFSS